MFSDAEIRGHAFIFFVVITVCLLMVWGEVVMNNKLDAAFPTLVLPEGVELSGTVPIDIWERSRVTV